MNSTYDDDLVYVCLRRPWMGPGCGWLLHYGFLVWQPAAISNFVGCHPDDAEKEE